MAKTKALVTAEQSGMFEMIRMLSTDSLLGRAFMAARAGVTFLGKRDVYRVLGYKDVLTPEDFRARFERNGVASRVVTAYPNSTWRGGAELIEDEDEDITTPFEEAWLEFAERLKVWSVFRKADILAGLGEYSIILIGAPGDATAPLTRLSSLDKIQYLQPYQQGDAVIESYEQDPLNPRFGLPLFYAVNRAAKGSMTGSSTSRPRQSFRVHWTRVHHIADTLDDPVLAIPKMKPVWNYLDDLDKVIGGGSEAYWQRANPGTQFDLDPDVKIIDAPGTQPGSTLKNMRDEIENFVHGMTRFLRTRGVKMEQMKADVADFDRNADKLITMIALTTGIPKRILEGSERGELASTQDKGSWDQRVNDRRLDFGEQVVIRPFVEHLVSLGALPEVEWEVRWPQSQDYDDQERAKLAVLWTQINKNMGQEVVTRGEIRDRVLDLPPIEETADFDAESEELRKEAELDAIINPPQPPGMGTGEEEEPGDTPKMRDSRQTRFSASSARRLRSAKRAKAAERSVKARTRVGSRGSRGREAREA